MEGFHGYQNMNKIEAEANTLREGLQSPSR